MTTVVSRLYDQVETAKRVADQLRAEGFPESCLSIVTSADAAALMAARIPAAAATGYAAKMQPGQAVFVCRAPFTPFGAARRAMDLADGMPAIAGANSYIREQARPAEHINSVLSSHPTLMTRDDYVGSGWAEFRASHLFGWPTYTRRREEPKNLITRSRPMSAAFWPGKLLSDKPRKSRVIAGGRLMLSGSRVGTSKSGRSSVLTGHPRISEKFGMRMLSGRN